MTPERLEEIRARFKRRKDRIRRKYFREKRKRLGRLKCLPRYSYLDCLRIFETNFKDTVDIAWATLRSQTKQYHQRHVFTLLSDRILRLSKTWHVHALSKEDIEQELRLIWWKTWVKYRKNVKKYNGALRRMLLKSGVFSLPFKIRDLISVPHTDNTLSADTVYEMMAEKPFELDLNYVLNGDIDHPLSLLSNKDRLILYLLQENPGRLNKVAKLLRWDKKNLYLALTSILELLNKETAYATTNTSRFTSGRTNVPTESDQGED